VQKEWSQSEQLLKERLQRADTQRQELENELSQCKINMANERLMTDEQLSSAKQRIRTEEVSLLQCSYSTLGPVSAWMGKPPRHRTRYPAQLTMDYPSVGRKNEHCYGHNWGRTASPA